jgi:LEA14-like dessication related protein
MRVTRFLPVAALIALAGCATLKTPTLQVEKIGKPQVGITGGQLEVVFGVRNPNPDDLLIERLEYELQLNGRRVGRGYVSDGFPLRGFERTTVRSHADLSLLGVARGVKEILDQDRVRAQVKGHFYVREGGGTRKLGFDSEAQVDLH